MGEVIEFSKPTHESVPREELPKAEGAMLKELLGAKRPSAKERAWLLRVEARSRQCVDEVRAELRRSLEGKARS